MHPIREIGSLVRLKLKLHPEHGHLWMITAFTHEDQSSILAKKNAYTIQSVASGKVYTAYEHNFEQEDTDGQ